MEAENGSLQEDCFLDHHVQLPWIFSVIIVIECNPSDAWPQTFIKLFWLSPQSSSPTSKGYPSKELGFKHPASANQWIWRNLGFWLIPQTIMATSQFQKPSFISLHHLFPTHLVGVKIFMNLNISLKIFIFVKSRGWLLTKNQFIYSESHTFQNYKHPEIHWIAYNIPRFMCVCNFPILDGPIHQIRYFGGI